MRRAPLDYATPSGSPMPWQSIAAVVAVAAFIAFAVLIAMHNFHRGFYF